MAVSVAAADSHNGWHSKSILMGGWVRQRGGGVWDWAGLRRTHSAPQPVRQRLSTGGRTLAGKRSHGDWVTTELDQGCGKQHLLSTLAHSQSHTHINTPAHTQDALAHTKESPGETCGKIEEGSWAHASFKQILGYTFLLPAHSLKAVGLSYAHGQGPDWHAAGAT